MFDPINYEVFGPMEALRFLFLGWIIEGDPSVIVLSVLFNLLVWGLVGSMCIYLVSWASYKPPGRVFANMVHRLPDPVYNVLPYLVPRATREAHRGEFHHLVWVEKARDQSPREVFLASLPWV